MCNKDPHVRIVCSCQTFFFALAESASKVMELCRINFQEAVPPGRGLVVIGNKSVNH